MRHATVVLLIAATVVFAAGPPNLLIAVRNGDHAAVQNLLRGGADANTSDNDGTTALMHAVLESDTTMMQLLIDAGADVNARNAAESTAIMYAATDLEKTRLLLSRGAQVKAKNKRGATPMSVAVTTFGATPVLKLLAAKGAEAPNSAMISAAQRGDLEAMQYLLSIGVSSGGADSGPLAAALGAQCDACVRLLLENGAPATGRGTGSSNGVLSQTAKRAMPEMSQVMLEHGASLDVKDREGFTLLMQAVESVEAPAARDRMVQWLLSRGADPNARNERGETAYQLAARVGASAAMEMLTKSGAAVVKDPEGPKPAAAANERTAVEKILPAIEMSGEAVFKNRGCVSCHNNSLPAMTVALARSKGFAVNGEQAKKELGFAVATEKPFLELMRLGSAIGGDSVTLGYTLMGMAAAGYAADALTDAHIHYLAMNQYPDGEWKHTSSYRPPLEYSPIVTTAVALNAMKLYPIPGRRKEFEERFARAKRWLLSARPYLSEERSMQVNGLATAGATAAELKPFAKALEAAQNQDGSWSQTSLLSGDAYATGEALYALHVSGAVPVTDPVYEKGVQWLLRNQLADGSWFVPARTIPVQPYFESGFPHGHDQWISDAASSWAAMALLFRLPDRR